MDSTIIQHSVDAGGTLKMLAEIALVVFTATLAWATFRLATHTLALSKLTERLVSIETSRDVRDQRDKRRKDLQVALLAAESVQKAYVGEFSQLLNKPADLPLSTMADIETLHSFKQYIKDPDCHHHLDALCSSFDSVRREKHQVRLNEDETAKRLKGLQDRIQWSVDEWRAELASN